MQLIHNQILQGFWIVVLPERVVRGTEKHVVQHLVVSKKYVRGRQPHLVPIVDDRIGSHNAVDGLGLLPDVESGGHLSLESRIVMDHFGDAPGLICCQSIHGVDYDSLDAPRTRFSAAMIKDGKQEALCLTGACPGSHNSRPRGVTAQSPECLLLM